MIDPMAAVKGGETDTIAAVATARGRAAIAVIRVSGDAAREVHRALTRRDLPPARHATLTRLIDPATGDLVDSGLVIWFEGPRSETGEDLLELHCHGGAAVQSILLDAIVALPGCRLAEPGEFIRRAFDHGKLDLTEIEGIADLIEAETQVQARQAARQMAGELGALYQGWADALTRILAHLEATIDFADEELPAGLVAQAQDEIDPIIDAVLHHLDDGRRGERLRAGLSVAIIGAPNAGKSTLLNRLAGRDAAIVSEEAGTTRDVVELHLDLGGYPITVADTAGLRDAGGAIEAEGMRRALLRAGEADLNIIVVDATDFPTLPDSVSRLLGPNCLIAVNKTDLRPIEQTMMWDVPVLPIVARGQGDIGALTTAIIGFAARYLADGAAPVLSRARHRFALQDAAAALHRAQKAVAVELVAEEMRQAVRALGRITGRVDVEDLLDLIFAEFCLGK